MGTPLQHQAGSLAPYVVAHSLWYTLSSGWGDPCPPVAETLTPNITDDLSPVRAPGHKTGSLRVPQLPLPSGTEFRNQTGHLSPGLSNGCHGSQTQGVWAGPAVGLLRTCASALFLWNSILLSLTSSSQTIIPPSLVLLIRGNARS